MDIHSLMILSAIMGMSMPQRPRITAADLKPEYDLIMQKKSKLPANTRQAIIDMYEELSDGY